MDLPDFKFVDLDYKLALPLLVLGIKIYNEDQKYEFVTDRKWIKIDHQTAGLACHHHYIVGTVLTPKSADILLNMVELSDKWLDSNSGMFGVSMLTEINEYASDLHRLFGVSCDSSWKDMEEAIYPIDCTTEHLHKMTKDKLPEDLDELIIWPDKLSKVFGSFNRWGLWILGENCD